MNQHRQEGSPLVLKHQLKLFAGFGKHFHTLFFPENFSQTGGRTAGKDRIELLLIEDDPSDASALLEMIKPGMSSPAITVKSSGAEALYYLKLAADQARADKIFLLLDFTLPDMNGLQLLARIRSEEKLKSLPVSVLTAFTSVQDIASAVQLKVISYMTKPSNPEQSQIIAKALDELLTAVFSPKTAIVDRSVGYGVFTSSAS
jgi:CheY-like chemotaxis protein